MHDIIVVGSATRDVFLTLGGVETRKHADSPTGVEQCFPLGTKLEVKEIVFTTGGGGTNTAVTFGRQGFKTACVGVIGNDYAGAEILKELKTEKVDTKFFQRHDDGHTAYSVILVNKNAERTILSYKGEGQHFSVKEIPVEKFKAKWLYLSSLGGHYDLFEALVGHASKKGIKIACNPGGKELTHGLEKLKPLLAKIDILITNREEGAALIGGDYKDWDGILAKLKEVIPGVVLVTDGKEGVRAVDAEGKKYQAGVPDSPVVERTGAGDAFGSGLMSEFMRSGDVAKSIQLGTANASSVVTKFGAKAGILREGDFGPWPLVEVQETDRQPS